MARKLNGLRRSTPFTIRTNSRKCKARIAKLGAGKWKGKRFQEIRFEVMGSSRKIRHCIIRFFGEKLTGETVVWVSCDCPYYRYTLEVANTTRDSSSVEYSTGAMPRKRNPHLRSGLCKHLYKASELTAGFRPKKQFEPINKEKELPEPEDEEDTDGRF
jgi:hypothetical protein